MRNRKDKHMEVDLDRVREALAENRERGLDSLNRLVELFPNEAAPLYARAMELIACDQAIYAVLDLHRAIDIQPEAAILYFARAQALSKNGSIVRAVDDSTRAIDLDPEQPSFYRFRAAQYELQEKADLAARDIEIAEVLEAERHQKTVSEKKAEEARLKAGL